MQTNQRQMIITGMIGLLASIMVGTGEFLLHFDGLGRFGEAGGYEFMKGISTNRTTIGHFIAVLGAPLYIVGFWHLMKMLEPANRLVSRVAFFIMSYGIIVGATWIGSRANISAIVNIEHTADLIQLVSLYDFRYENLLQVTRLSVMMFSMIFISLTITGRSHYPRWMAIFNPILLLLSSFAIWFFIPAVGIYLMPIALNIAFGLLFLISIIFTFNINNK
ncbi:MAG: hypothetical protein ACI85N_002000 [Gammaproteobacteria bacterium]|jgi:hypothetical protein